jgi:hypothetical protein
MPPKRPSLELEAEAYLYIRRRARLDKHLRQLFMTPCHAVSQTLRGEWAMQTPKGSIRPTETSATRSLLDIGGLVKVIGGRGQELRGFVKPCE